MNLEEFGPDAKDEMSPADYIKFLMDKFYEYRTLAMDPTINDQATKLYLDKASEYYARAQEAIDEIEPDNTDHLSDEDKALPNVPLDEKDEELSDRDKAMVDDYEEEEANREVPRDYASMYENKTKNNKMENINLNRWAKLAGINENDDNASLKEGTQEWEGSINSLGKDDNPEGFAEMRDIILSKYPNEGGSTYRMEVYYNNDNVATGTSGGFAIEKGNVYFDFKFQDGKVVDYSFNEQNY
jgi:hypothetical protein